MKNISADLPAILKQRYLRYLTFQNQMKNGCARRTRSFNKIKLNSMVVLDISQTKRLPWAPLTLQKENFWRNLLMKVWTFNNNDSGSSRIWQQDGLSSANIANIEDEPPKKYRWQMTKKAVELVTHPRGFYQKKHPAFSQKSVIKQQLPDSLQ